MLVFRYMNDLFLLKKNCQLEIIFFPPLSIKSEFKTGLAKSIGVTAAQVRNNIGNTLFKCIF